MIDATTFSDLLNRASKLGAKNIEVVGWLPPETALSNPSGNLVVIDHANDKLTGHEIQWFDK